MMMGRSSALAFILLALVAGCKSESRRQTAPAAVVREHRTFTLDTDGAPDAVLAVQDLVTREPLTFERRGPLLVLLARAGVIDTLSIAPDLPSDALSLRQIDSSFLEIARRSTDDSTSRSADVVCIADGRLHWAAHLPLALRLPGEASALGVYSTRYALPRTPLAITGVELFTPPVGDTSARAPWQHGFDLRFDDGAHAFYNAEIALDSVPLAGGDRVVTGVHPGIALRIGTSVKIDGRWYALSVPSELDPDEFARGTVGLVLEGKREWGDTLR